MLESKGKIPENTGAQQTMAWDNLSMLVLNSMYIVSNLSMSPTHYVANS